MIHLESRILINMEGTLTGRRVNQVGLMKKHEYIPDRRYADCLG